MITHVVESVATTPDPESFESERQPRVVFAYGNQNTAADGVRRSGGNAGFGWSCGGTQEIAVGSGNFLSSGLEDSGNCIVNANFTAKNQASDTGSQQLNMTRLCRPDGFSWNKNFPYASQMMSRLEVAGGSNFECFSGTFSSPTIAEGATTRVVTGVGFEPQLILLLWAKTPWFTPDSAVSWGGPSFGMGAADDSLEQWAFQTQNGYLGLSTSTTSMQKSGVCFVSLASSGAGTPCTGTLVSMDSDGFTISFNRADNRPGNAFGSNINGRLIGFLALRDSLGGFKVGTGTQAASTGAAAVVSGLSFQPQAVLLAHGNCDNTSSIYSGRGPWHIGGFDGLSQSNILNGRFFGRRLATSAITFADTGTNVVAEADGSLDVDGFTLDWSSTDGTARPFGWVAMATEGWSPDCPKRGFQQIYRRVL